MGITFDLHDGNGTLRGAIVATEREANGSMIQHSLTLLHAYHNQHDCIVIVDVDESSHTEPFTALEQEIHEKIAAHKGQHKSYLDNMGYGHNMEREIIAEAKRQGMPVIPLRSFTEHLLTTGKQAISQIQPHLLNIKPVESSVLADQKAYLDKKAIAFNQSDDMGYWNLIMEALPRDEKQQFIDLLMKDRVQFLANRVHHLLNTMKDNMLLVLCNTPEVLGPKGMAITLREMGWQLRYGSHSNIGDR